MFPLVYKIAKAMVNLLYPITQRFNNKCGIDSNADGIISLTTFPERVDKIWIVISSLLNQTKKPKAIFLWLAEEQFEGKQLPKSLTRLCKRGLTIKYCDDIRSHKKYYYTMKENPQDIVITVDDDMFYPENFLEIMFNCHQKYPKAVVCMLSNKIRISDNGEFAEYSEWKRFSDDKPNYLLLPIGCNGVLYPAGSLHSDVFDKDEFRKHAMYTDDLWLKCMAVRNKTRAVNASIMTSLDFFDIVSSQKFGLWKTNTMAINRNDLSWKSLMARYPDVAIAIKEENDNEL